MKGYSFSELVALAEAALPATATAVAAHKLHTARTIGGVAFDGTKNINLPGVNTTGNQNTTGSSASCTGNAATATKLQTARKINGKAFDGTADITLSSSDVGAAPLSHTHTPAQVGLGALSVAESGLNIDGQSGATQQFVDFRTVKTRLIVEAVRQGIYRPDNGWRWCWDDGVLTTGTVPWARLKDVPAQATRWPTRDEIGAAASSHTHPWAQITGVPVQATRWPTLAEIGAQAAGSYAAASHTHAYAPLTGGGTSGTWPISITGSSASTTGNAASATVLQTARTLTIGSTGKSFNGSGNVAWSLAEIGAAAASHTHPVSQVTGLGTAATRNVGTTVGTVPLIGEATRLTSTTDLNSLATPNHVGEYRWAGSAPVNAPSGASYAYLRITSWGDGAQQHILDSNGVSYSRNKTNSSSGWTSWVSYYHTGNMPATATRWPTPGEIGAQPAGSYAAASHTHAYAPLTGAGTSGTWPINITGQAATASSAAKLTAARTIGGTSFDGTADINPLRLGFQDTRAQEFTPASARTYLQVTFQNGNSNGVGAASADYYSMLHVPQYPDASGGWGSQIAFTKDGKVRHRKGTSDTTWSPWAVFYTNQNKPTAAEIGAQPAGSYAAASHTHPWSQVTGVPVHATRWPNWTEVTDKPSTMPPSSHTHPWSQITGVPVQATRWPTPAEVGLGNVVNKGWNYGAIGDTYAVRNASGDLVARQFHGTHVGDGSNLTNLQWARLTGVPVQATRWPTPLEISAAQSGGIKQTGNSRAISTSEFVAWVKSVGGISTNQWSCKMSWSYAANGFINDTGVGNIQLAGATITTWGNASAYTIEVIAAPASNVSGNSPNARYIYQNHGADYVPTWVRSYDTGNKPTPSEIGAQPAGSYAAASHTHPWSQITGVPVQATRWPTLAEIGAQAAGSYAAASHTHPWTQITGAPVYTTRWPNAAEVGLSNVPNTAHTTADTANTVAVRDAAGVLRAKEFVGKHSGDGYGLSNIKFSSLVAVPVQATRWPNKAEVGLGNVGNYASSARLDANTHALRDGNGDLIARQFHGTHVGDGSNLINLQWARLVGVPATASRWPTWEEVSGKPRDVNAWVVAYDFGTNKQKQVVIPVDVKNHLNAGGKAELKVVLRSDGDVMKCITTEVIGDSLWRTGKWKHDISFSGTAWMFYHNSHSSWGGYTDKVDCQYKWIVRLEFRLL
ncbi:tail fiber protein [Shewanella phage Spp001]|uniref:Tail fiber repeat family protein n=1 Tax=Shewanella phage Spp001 TaxID=1445859 RepID=W6EBX6_9CAUD|nr:tail fiber protein [Shewanella phage Spp001]AHJ10575.1 tail fiber repeat family protein [Shewanella phage Spp001]